jgi:ferredoxin
VTGTRLRVDWVRCGGHLSCADLLPELIGVDEWGYPVPAPGPVPPDLLRLARRARSDCPRLALRLTPGDGADARRVPSGT